MVMEKALNLNISRTQLGNNQFLFDIEREIFTFYNFSLNICVCGVHLSEEIPLNFLPMDDTMSSHYDL